MDGEEVVLDAPLDDAPVETDVQPEIDVTDPPDTEANPDDAPPEEKAGDGRALPRDVQKALKALRENPETAASARADPPPSAPPPTRSSPSSRIAEAPRRTRSPGPGPDQLKEIVVIARGEFEALGGLTSHPIVNYPTSWTS